jgi:manganese/iron transport system ATP-binding protein
MTASAGARVRSASKAPDAGARQVDVLLADVSTGYGVRPAVEHATLTVEAGTLLAVVGPNGAGKSTLLKVMAGLLPVWTGRVEVLGERPGKAAHRIAYVPQAELVDWQFPVTVEGVVAMGRYPRLGWVRRPGAADRRAVADALELVGMADHTGTQIGELSGGQRRRVFLARALAAEPDLFLLDEPVTGVDATTQEDIMDILEGQAASGKTVVATTHDLACAAQRFQRVAGVNRTVIAQGPASVILKPEVLARIYGGHLLVVGHHTYLMDDAHHHDEPAGGEQHFHAEREATHSHPHTQREGKD